VTSSPDLISWTAEGVDALVQVPVGRRAADLVVGGQLGQPGAVTEPAQYQHHLPVAAHRPPPGSRASPTPLAGLQADTNSTVSPTTGSTAV